MSGDRLLDVDWPRAVLVALSLAVALALVVAGATSSTAFGTYNPAWEGTADLRASIGDATADDPLLRDAARYDDLEADGTLAIVLSPASAYGSDADRLRDFVRRGGTVLVAEDFGPHANPLLAAIGASARVDGRPLYDTRRYYRRTALPVADPVSEDALVADVPSLTMNRPTAVRPGDATVLVETSPYAFLDADGDAELDDAESMRRHPVATVEPVGDGRVVVVSDPSAFINRMLERPGNRAFVDGLLARDDRAVLDVSHAGGLPPLRGAVFAVRDSAGLQVALGVLALALVALLARRPAISRFLPGARRSAGAADVRLTGEEIAGLLARRHPEWDEARIGRITTRLRRRRRRGGR